MEISYASHWKAAKIILIYVKGTIDYGIFYQANFAVNLVGYTDNDFGGSVDDN
jgi:hypothetical protein